MAEKTSLGRAYVQIMPTTDGIKGRLQEALGGASEEAGRSAGAGWASSFGDMLKANLVTEGIKMALDGAKQLGEQVVDLAKTAVDSYADYEQLVGGVETLFKDSADQVQQYASQAYKTAGLSANEYMETTTSFAASLLQSLNGDTQAAAGMANMAVTDMADNANKMGSDMSSIQNAYQGFAKQNYTMLDNLKLGYGGTQQEMFRLLQDAAGLNEEFARTANFSLDSKGHLEAGYADIVRAIHIVQTEMKISGITAEEAAELVRSGAMTEEEAFEMMGTTAKEAATTIQGSLASMRSAWANLVTGLADENANFDELVQNFVDSALVAGDNLIPRIGQALTGVGQLIDGLAPVIAAKIPELAPIIIPPIIGAAGQVMAAVASALPSLAGPVITALLQSVDAVGAAIGDKVPALAFIFDNLSGVIVGVTAAFAAYKAVLIAQQVATIAAAIAQGQLNLAMIANPVGLVVAAIAGLVAAVVTLWNTNEGFRNAVISAGQAIVSFVKGAVDTVVNFFTGVIDFVANNWQGLLLTLVNPFAGAFKLIYDNCEEFRGFFDNLVRNAWNWGSDLVSNFVSGITGGLGRLRDAMTNMASEIWKRIHFSEPDEGPLSNFSSYAPDMMALFAKGIRDNEGLVRSQMERSFTLPEQNTMRYEPASMPMRLVGVNEGTLRALSATSGTGSNGRPIVVTLEMNRTEWGRGIFQLYNEEKQRMGVSLVAT